MLEEFYRVRRGSAFPGYDACLLIDTASFTLGGLKRRAAAGNRL